MHTIIPHPSPIRRAWQDAAGAWHRLSPFINRWLLPATSLALDLARIQPGSRVLDIAAGDGGQTLLAADRAGPDGLVLAVDVSARLLASTAETAWRTGGRQIVTALMDAGHLAVGPGTFHAALCRLGFEHLPDPLIGLVEARRVLKPGGTLVIVLLSTPDQNPFFSFFNLRPQDAAPTIVQAFFRLGQRGVLENAMERAGFRRVETRVLDTPMRFSSLAEARHALRGYTRLAFPRRPASRPDSHAIETALRCYQNGYGKGRGNGRGDGRTDGRSLIIPGEVVIGVGGV